MQLEALPNEPSTDWSMKSNGWIHLRLTDPIIPWRVLKIFILHLLILKIHLTRWRDFWLLDSLLKLSTRLCWKTTVISQKRKYIGAKLVKNEWWPMNTSSLKPMRRTFLFQFVYTISPLVYAFLFTHFSPRFYAISIYFSTNFFLKLPGRLCPLSELVNIWSFSWLLTFLRVFLN